MPHPEEFRIMNSKAWCRRVTREEFMSRLKGPMPQGDWEMLAGGKPGWAYTIGGEWE
jgi:hypothetical protein